MNVASDGELSIGCSERWVGTEGSFPLSVSMPLRDEPYPGRIVLPWLANLLPEQGQLQSLARVLGYAQSNVVAILERIGGILRELFRSGNRPIPTDGITNRSRGSTVPTMRGKLCNATSMT